MYSNAQLFLLHALSSVHAGSGSEIGIVDLPIQREHHTGFPKIESSSLKGAVRSTVEENATSSGVNKLNDKIERVFGSKITEGKKDGIAGAITLADARILLFPVKSLKGVFVWLTCPYVLKRFNQEVLMYIDENKKCTVPVPEDGSVSSDKIMISDSVVLEEYTFKVEIKDETKKLAEELEKLLFDNQGLQISLSDRLVVLTDDEFKDFVKLSTEVHARIRIDSDTGVVDNGSLWYEENVPPETVFYSFVFAGKTRNLDEQKMTDKEVMEFLKDEETFPSVFQLGGNSTLGKGMLRRIWV